MIERGIITIINNTMIHCATQTTKRSVEKLLQLKQASILSIYFVFEDENNTK